MGYAIFTVCADEGTVRDNSTRLPSSSVDHVGFYSRSFSRRRRRRRQLLRLYYIVSIPPCACRAATPANLAAVPSSSCATAGRGRDHRRRRRLLRSTAPRSPPGLFSRRPPPSPSPHATLIPPYAYRPGHRCRARGLPGTRDTAGRLSPGTPRNRTVASSTSTGTSTILPKTVPETADTPTKPAVFQ